MGVCAGVVVAACGGKAVMDGTNGVGGSAGSGGTTTTSSHTTSTSTTHSTGMAGSGAPGDPCVEAQDLVTENNLAALACDPTIFIAQCTGSAIIRDLCGCQVIANENNPTAVQAAHDAYASWIGIGCGPMTCDVCPVFSPSSCVADSTGTTGSCTVVMPL